MLLIIVVLLIQIALQVYLQCTVMTAVASVDPTSLVTVHLYWFPFCALVTFPKNKTSDKDSTRPLVSPTLIHVMFGCGLPVTLQTIVTLWPSITVPSDGPVIISGLSLKGNKVFQLPICWVSKYSHTRNKQTLMKGVFVTALVPLCTQRFTEAAQDDIKYFLR